MGNVVIVGSSNTDMVFGTSRMPQRGETVMGETFDQLPGGKGANQAVATARAGAEVHFIAKVGADDLGQAAIENYRRDGIRTDFISQTDEAASGVAMIMVDSNSGENAIVVAPGANALLSPEDIEAASEVIQAADVLLVQLETPLPTVQRALEIAHEQGVTTILNPAPAQGLSDHILALVDYLTPNETETEFLCGILPKDKASTQHAAQALTRYVKNVIITLGSEGSFLRDADGHTAQIPTGKVQAVDTTAAGDVFNGYLAAALADGESLKKAIARANRAAAISVTKKGAQPSIPYRVDLS
ncbi:MAG TPA: ribokinase [Saprospiraceae bacterium]|nr:ribokinase [Saprospiraceae bacterium]